MVPRASMMAGLARQLAHPQGVRGRLVGAMLNRANQAAVSAAVEALPLTDGDTVADLGFGGGVGLDRLLRHVGTSGHVDGVDVSATILRHAARRFRRDIATGRLRLHAASMTELSAGLTVKDQHRLGRGDGDQALRAGSPGRSFR